MTTRTMTATLALALGLGAGLACQEREDEDSCEADLREFEKVPFAVVEDDFCDAVDLVVDCLLVNYSKDSLVDAGSQQILECIDSSDICYEVEGAVDVIHNLTMDEIAGNSNGCIG